MRTLVITVVALTLSIVAAPASVIAQEAPPPPPPVESLGESEMEPAEPEQDDPAAEKAEAEVETGERVDGFTAGRAGSEVLTGFGMMVGGTLAGALTGFLVGSIAATPGSVEAGVGTAIGAAAGYLVGTPVGVWLGGNAMHGNGSLWATSGGAVGGILVGGALSGIISASTGGTGGAEFWMIAMPITGGIIGYELTSGPPSGQDSGVSLRLGVSPSAEGRGTLLNLTGRW